MEKKCTDISARIEKFSEIFTLKDSFKGTQEVFLVKFTEKFPEALTDNFSWTFSENFRKKFCFPWRKSWMIYQKRSRRNFQNISKTSCDEILLRRNSRNNFQMKFLEEIPEQLLGKFPKIFAAKTSEKFSKWNLRKYLQTRSQRSLRKYFLWYIWKNFLTVDRRECLELTILGWLSEEISWMNSTNLWLSLEESSWRNY